MNIDLSSSLYKAKIPKLVVVLALFFHSLCFAIDNDALLHQADLLSLPSPSEAKLVLKEIDTKTLLPHQKNLFEYLNIRIATFELPVSELEIKYENLLYKIQDPVLKIRTMTSLLNIITETGHWKKGLLLANELQQSIKDITDSEYRNRVYLVLSSFYYHIGSNGIALEFSEKLIDDPKVSNIILCTILPLNLSIKIKLEMTEELKFADFDRAIGYCEENGLQVLETVARYYLLQFLYEKERFYDAMVIGGNGLAVAEEQALIPQRYSYYGILSKIYLAAGDSENAVKYARLVEDWLDSFGRFPEASAPAYEVLFQISHEAQDYKSALHYMQLIAEQKQRLYNEQLAKDLAVHEVEYELSLKEAKIALLDQENVLLKTQASLASKQILNTLLALVLVSVVVAFLLYMFYRIRKTQSKLRYLAHIDALTGLHNRSYFIDKSSELLVKAKEKQKSVSMILFNMDLLRNLNDSYSHNIGDMALREVSRILKTSFPKNTIIARVGGEEFGLLLDGFVSSEAVKLADSCRVAIESFEFRPGLFDIKLTSSAGVSSTVSTGYNFDSLYTATDIALSRSKKLGRNKVYLYE